MSCSLLLTRPYSFWLKKLGSLYNLYVRTLYSNPIFSPYEFRNCHLNVFLCCAVISEDDSDAIESDNMEEGVDTEGGGHIGFIIFMPRLWNLPNLWYIYYLSPIFGEGI